MCKKEGEYKLTALKLVQLFVRHIRNVNLLFREDFKSAELLSKTCFFVYFRSVLKMAKETNKGGVESICPNLWKVCHKLSIIWFTVIMKVGFPAGFGNGENFFNCKQTKCSHIKVISVDLSIHSCNNGAAV